MFESQLHCCKLTFSLRDFISCLHFGFSAFVFLVVTERYDHNALRRQGVSSANWTPAYLVLPNVQHQLLITQSSFEYMVGKKTTLQWAFLRGLYEQLRDDLTARDTSPDLESVISLLIHLEDRLREGLRERASYLLGFLWPCQKLPQCRIMLRALRLHCKVTHRTIPLTDYFWKSPWGDTNVGDSV